MDQNMSSTLKKNKLAAQPHPHASSSTLNDHTKRSSNEPMMTWKDNREKK
jgi:hypothetical protein